MNIPMTDAVAQAVYDVLVRLAGAPKCDALSFVHHYSTVSEHGPSGEWRFQGALGFGGKFRFPQFVIDCYREDRTADRDSMVEQVNEALADLRHWYEETLPWRKEWFRVRKALVDGGIKEDECDALLYAAHAAQLRPLYAMRGTVYVEGDGCKGGVPWNPRSDDGDAFRLAACLHMDLKHLSRQGETSPYAVMAQVDCAGSTDQVAKYDGGVAAGMRQAVFQAAAERGRIMMTMEAR